MRKAIPKKLREEIKNRFGGRCGYCGEIATRLQIDHVHPVACGHWLENGNAVNDPSNLMPACFSCNNYKMSMSLEQFRTELKYQVGRAREHSLNFRLAERFGLLQVIERPIEFYFERKKKGGEG